jgi:hypothetical protein
MEKKMFLFLVYLYCILHHINKEKHKLVQPINRSLDRETNPLPLAYGNTASIPFYFCGRGFGLVVSVVVPLMLALHVATSEAITKFSTSVYWPLHAITMCYQHSISVLFLSAPQAQTDISLIDTAGGKLR